jgi:DNA-binding NarL/FixJ family response regulator
MFAETLGIEKISVLLVEDSRNEAHVTQQQLYAVDDEFNISRVSRLDEALELAAHEKFGVIILDLGLPDSSGPQSIQMLSQKFPDLPIVVLSGRSDTATVRCALEFGAQEFLVKSECSGNMIRQALLGAIIRKSLESKRPLPH